jgi:hypothetical protein
MNAAELLKRALAGTQGHTPQPITDEFAKAIAKRLESRGIVKVPGLEDDQPESESDRIRAALDRYEAAVREIEAEREAKRLADEEAAQNERTTAGIVRSAIAGSSSSSDPIPLNGARVLRAALSGLGTNGTINGGVAE